MTVECGMRTGNSIGRLATDRRGVAAAEFALCLPFLLMLIMGIFDFGSLAYTDMQVNAAAHAGAQWVYANNSNGVSNGCTPTTVKTAVQSAVEITVTAAASTACSVSYCVKTAGTLVAPTNGACPAATTNGEPPGTYAVVSASTNVTALAPWSSLTMPSSLTATAAIRYQ